MSDSGQDGSAELTPEEKAADKERLMAMHKVAGLDAVPLNSPKGQAIMAARITEVQNQERLEAYFAVASEKAGFNTTLLATVAEVKRRLPDVPPGDVDEQITRMVIELIRLKNRPKL